MDEQTVAWKRREVYLEKTSKRGKKKSKNQQPAEKSSLEGKRSCRNLLILRVFLVGLKVIPSFPCFFGICLFQKNKEEFPLFLLCLILILWVFSVGVPFWISNASGIAKVFDSRFFFFFLIVSKIAMFLLCFSSER